MRKTKASKKARHAGAHGAARKDEESPKKDPPPEATLAQFEEQ